jgi:hypothetical protein
MGPPQETVTEKPVETLPEFQASPLQRVEAIRLLQEFESISLSTTLYVRLKKGCHQWRARSMIADGACQRENHDEPKQELQILSTVPAPAWAFSLS